MVREWKFQGAWKILDVETLMVARLLSILKLLVLYLRMVNRAVVVKPRNPKRRKARTFWPFSTLLSHTAHNPSPTAGLKEAGAETPPAPKEHQVPGFTGNPGHLS